MSLLEGHTTEEATRRNTVLRMAAITAELRYSIIEGPTLYPVYHSGRIRCSITACKFYFPEYTYIRAA